jgi:hypothetical protein
MDVEETSIEAREPYEPPAVLATYSIEELRAEAATCLGDFSGPN